MRESSVFNLSLRFLCRAVLIVCLAAAAIAALELIKAYYLFSRMNHLLGYAYAAAMALALIGAAYRLISFAMDHRTLDPPPFPDAESATHDDMKSYCRYLVHLLKRLGQNECLDEEMRKALRQEAYDIDDMFGAHPLNDDLRQAISTATGGILVAAFAKLRERADRHARERMRFVVQDVLQPPFPVVNSFVVLYHEVALVSDIVQTYLHRPALFEHFMVLRDVRTVMAEGRLMTLGQNLTEGVYVNAPPLGNTIHEIGSALTSLWLTHMVALVAAQRCESMDEWQVTDAIEQIDASSGGTIVAVKESLTDDVIPLLRLRIRHAAPEGTQDPAAYSKFIVDGIAKALDTLSNTLKRQPVAKSLLLTRRQSVADEPLPAEASAPRGSGRRSSRKSHRARSPVLRVLQTFGQRIKYTIGPGHHS